MAARIHQLQEEAAPKLVDTKWDIYKDEMLIHRNNGSLAMFPQQKDRVGESVPCIRQYFLHHPLQLQLTVTLGHPSTTTRVQISKCSGEGKNYRRFTETSTVQPLKTRGVMWL